MERREESGWNVYVRPLKERNGKKRKCIPSNEHSASVVPNGKRRKWKAVKATVVDMKFFELDCFPFSVGVLTLSSSSRSIENLSARFVSLCANRGLCRVCGSQVNQSFLLCFSCFDVYHYYCAPHVAKENNSVAINQEYDHPLNLKWLCSYCKPCELCSEPLSKDFIETCASCGLCVHQSCRVKVVKTSKRGLQCLRCEKMFLDPVDCSSSVEDFDETSLKHAFCVVCANAVTETAGLYCSLCNRYVHKKCDHCTFELSTLAGFYPYNCPSCRQKNTVNLELGTLKFSYLMEEPRQNSLQVSDRGREVNIVYRNAVCPFFTYVMGRRICISLHKSVLSKILLLENSTAEQLSSERLPVIIKLRLDVLKHIEHLKSRILKDAEVFEMNCLDEKASKGLVLSDAKESPELFGLKNLSCEVPTSVIQEIVERDQVNGLRGTTSNVFQTIHLSSMEDYRFCAFCKLQQTSLGRLLPIFDDSAPERIRWVHSQCALFAAETFEDNTGNIHRVTNALSRSQRARCFSCKQPGATVGCCMSRCQRNYHLPCSIRTSGKFVNEKFYCSEHAKKLKASSEAIKSCPVSVEGDPQRCLYILQEKRSYQSFATSKAQYAYLRVGSFMLIFPGCLSAEYAFFFHDQDILFPLGYISCRYFWSVDQPERVELYTFHISMNEKRKPLFEIYSATRTTSNFTWPIQGLTPDEAWKHLLSRNPAIESKLDGKAAFGLSIPAVRFILEHLPEIDKCRNYVPHYVKLSSIDNDTEMDWNDRLSTCARLEPYRGFRMKTKPEVEIKSVITQNGLCLPSMNKNVFNDVRFSDQQIQNYSTSYRRMRRRWRQRCKVKQSGIQGLGLYTLENLPDEEFVIEYAGELIRPVIADIREKFYDRRKIGCYMFRLNDDFIVDATMKGNYARFINHSCEPNCRSKIITVDGDKQVIGIFAKRNIAAGEELTYDYQFEEFGETIPCNCGAPNCRGKMN
ncbi:Histone-lysine N-methyltransferase trr [Galdieria sulphuraria]|uniref:Myeloid/lymphoid or mixed-lineage leukemia protein 3 n=1 Tax=Galdieria sulphuraria TaxID=130081 RepID=M2W281_GALSU|nr:myeloid/lymphoid or mixed-lineage leukemia protein 3 [Galdieria sulphuraria]EME29801.1 myeloid/lymphoid or mixed-lineage leukemia protein 3 [Galdieria sulphuraria]GJD06790.1 Histone-lysine N-methyltransferase trr [Galdieria sulphuraria]|eukprot:XP_005706321.1 myeloid/lymphoid or mixed-lineage leukemia protein 3 [Galdieria sulphuraria]